MPRFTTPGKREDHVFLVMLECGERVEAAIMNFGELAAFLACQVRADFDLGRDYRDIRATIRAVASDGRLTTALVVWQSEPPGRVRFRLSHPRSFAPITHNNGDVYEASFDLRDR